MSRLGRKATDDESGNNSIGLRSEQSVSLTFSNSGSLGIAATDIGYLTSSISLTSPNNLSLKGDITAHLYYFIFHDQPAS